GINSYATYNLITASAPEIAGLWSMYPIPGTKDKNGKINRAQSSGGTASIILKAATEHNVEKESWEFIKWWTSAETQIDYAARLEGTMGVAARYTPANIEAFKSIKWTPAESKALLAQWNEVYNVREIPGNYYIQRSLTSAIRNTISKGTSIRFNLAKYNKDIISEITRKRKEFNIK
ncbi:MAG: ABC transporter substrate-binding protein, partial [Clostridia bacterium]|nr:ABC transporter substrate-binding protein [Clostridia bacterium]